MFCHAVRYCHDDKRIAAMAMMTITATDGTQPLTLLQRRHDQLCLDVEHAALGLFARHGYNAVTVDDIAAVAGISARTFYRHFPTKEEVLVGELRRRIDSVAAYIVARPANESAVATLRHAILLQVKEADRETFGDWVRVISSEPSLFARVSGIAAVQRRNITGLLAARLGVDPATDLRPGVIAASMLAAAEHAFTLWFEGAGRDSLPTATERALAFVEQGLHDSGSASDSDGDAGL
jgi:AcrR family transcriptional regulator